MARTVDKICHKCNKIKPLTDFYKHWDPKQQKYYPRFQCKACSAISNAKYRKTDKYKLQRSIYNKTYYESGKGKATYSAYAKTSKGKNIRAIYKTRKRKNDINFRLLANLRTRIWYALKYNQKNTFTIKLIGCSIFELKQYLKSKFQVEMTFDNYGKWHIDHIKPCSSFDLSKESEQKKCFHYTNLQPLWAKDNLKKYNKYFKEVA